MSAFQKERLACAYFFAVPGLIYGIFTARLPALKAMTGADDGMIGFLLLAFGAASFTGLLSCNFVMEKAGARRVMGYSSLVFPAAMCVGGLALSYWQLLVFCMLGGFAGGLCEVAMNAQGVVIEKRYKVLCMASLHACFSLGGAAGSLTGSLFARLELAPVWNFLIISLLYLLVWPLAYNKIYDEKSGDKGGATSQGHAKLPLFIYLCGLMSMLCYVSEGSVGEWGSILLHSVKGAPQDQAALVFASFCTTMVIFRFMGDRLRGRFGDFPIVLFGGLLGAACMTFILLSSSPVACLLAYGVMGIGFAPIVPILISRAGQCPGISPGRATSMVSIMSYTGLLAFPPLLGMLGDVIGLGKALWIIAACCLGVALGSPLLLQKRKGMNCG